MIKNNLLFYLLCALASSLLGACDSSGMEYPYAPLNQGDIEAIVLNEGLITHNQGEISAVNKDGTAVPAVFQQVNRRTMGDVAQSLTLINDSYFVALSNSGKIEVIDPLTFESKGTITYKQAGSPRQVVAISPTEGIVSDLNRQLVRIRIAEPYGHPLEYISIPFGIEYMAVTAGKLFGMTPFGLYVFDTDNIRKEAARVIPEIKGNESSKTAQMLTDKNGRLWTLMQESAIVNDESRFTAIVLSCIDPLKEKVIQQYRLPINHTSTVRPGDVVDAPGYNRTDIDPTGTWIYFNAKTLQAGSDEGNIVHTVFRLHVDTGEMQPYMELPGVDMMYGFAVGPEGDVYLCDCLDYTAQRGYIRKYRPDGTVRSSRVGVYPSQVYFPR